MIVKIQKKPGRKKKSYTVRDCDNLWSKFIRTRDTLHWGAFPGVRTGRCACCGSSKGYSELDCGHYVGRQFWKYRWDERNTAACCIHCNRFLEGNKGPFARWIDRKWGAGTAEMLDGTKKGGRKPKPYELKEIYEQIQDKLNQQKGSQ